MRQVKVNKSELLKKLIENRVKHIADYKESCDGYREQALESLNDRRKEIDQAFSKLSKRIEDGEIAPLQIGVNTAFTLKVPESHEKDYDQVIKMVEMSVDEQLTLDSDEFSMYVMDDWEWKREFETTSNMYKMKK